MTEKSVDVSAATISFGLFTRCACVSAGENPCDLRPQTGIAGGDRCCWPERQAWPARTLCFRSVPKGFKITLCTRRWVLA